MPNKPRLGLSLMAATRARAGIVEIDCKITLHRIYYP
jgi:hypothetical protein